MNTHNSLTLIAQSLILNDGTVDCKRESLIKSSLFKNPGTFTSHTMRFDGDEIINQGTLAIRDTFRCTSKMFFHSGILDVFRNCIMEKGDEFFSTASSVWNVNGDWKSLITSLHLKGSFNLKNLFVVSKNFTTESPLHCIAENAHLEIEEDMNNAGVIKILGLLDVDSKNIILEKTSCIMVDNADLKVNQAIQNEGTVSVKNHLSAHAHTISNAGKIETNSASIKSDRYYYNKILSVLSAKNNLTINTPVYFNLLGLTHAQCLMINSVIGVNSFGIYAAKNMGINSLLSLNAGLFLPKFSAFSEIYSRTNLWGFGESLFIKCVPIYGVMYAALKNIQGTYHQGKTLYSEIGSLYRQKSIGASSVIALICSIKNTLSSIGQTFNLGKQNYRLLSNSSSQTDITTKPSDSPQSDNSQGPEGSPNAIAKAKNIAQQVVSTAVSHYAPSVTTSAIVDHNYGVAVGINNNSTNFYNHNSNTSMYVQNTIDTHCGENVGYLGAYNLNINATNSYDSDGNIRIANGNIETYYLRTKGPINAFKDITLQGKESADIKGDVTAEKIAIKSDSRLTIKSRLTSANTHLHAKNIDQHGMITAQQVIMKGDCVSNYGTLKAPKIIITQANFPGSSRFIFRNPSLFYNEGNLQASEQLFVDAKDIRLGKKSQVSAPNAYFKSDDELYNAGKMDTEQLVLNAQRNMTNTGSLKAHKLLITQEKLDNNSWCASGRIFRNQGDLQVSEQLLIDAHNIHLDKGSQVSAPNAYFKSNGEWKNDGDITSEEVVLDAKKDITHSGLLKAHKLFIVHSGPDYNGWLRGWCKNHYEFLNQGALQVSERIFVDAKDIHLDKKSQVFAPSARFISAANWRNEGQLKVEQCLIESKRNAINDGTINATQLLHLEAQNILFQPNSSVKTKDAYYKAEQNILIDGVMDVERGSVEAGDKVRTIGKMRASDRLDIDAKNIIIETTSHVSAPITHLEATETINNRGKLSTSDLYAHAKYVQNLGEIISDNKAHIKADRYFWNQFVGSINVENNLDIDALLSLNSLGYISADSMCTNSIIDVNLLGIYRGNNICQNSFISYNKGILIPKCKSLEGLKKSLEENPLRFAESFVFQLVPRLAKPYSLLKSTVMCFSKDKKEASLWDRAKTLKKDINDLYNKEDLCINDVLPISYQTLKKNINDLYNKKDLCVSDVVPVLCQGKNLLTSTIQTGCQIAEVGQQISQVGQQIYQGGQQAYQNAQNYLNSTSNTTEKSVPKQSNVAQQIYQGGQQAYQNAQNYLNSTSNATEKSAQKQSNVAQQIYQGGQQAYQDAQNYLNNTSKTTEKSVQEQNKLITIISASIPFIETAIEAAASTAASIAGPQLSRNSLFDCNDGVMLGVNSDSQSLYNMNSGISFFANNNSISTISGTNSGFIGGSNVSVNASQSYVSDGILGAANITVVAKNLEIAGNTHAFNNILLKAHRNAVIDRKIKAQNITLLANNMLVKENASIDSSNTTNVIATQKLLNKGTIDGKQTVVKGNKVILGNGSKILTHGDDGCAEINATELTLKNGSHIDTDTALIDAQSIHGDQGNTITSRQGTTIKTNKIDNKGNIDGITALDFAGDATQLGSIGTVDQLIYSGTLTNNIADKLANGNNEVLSVNKDGAVNIRAQQKDVHFKEQHNMTHALHVDTTGTIQCDKDLLSEKSILLQTKKNVHHANIKSKEITGLIGKNISSEGHVSRATCGENYTETCEKNIVSGNQVIIQAQRDINYTGTHVHSEIGGTQVYAGGKLIADTLETQTYSKTNKIEPGKFPWSTPTETTVVEQTTTSIPCSFSSEGATRIVVGDGAKLHGTIFESKGGTHIQARIEDVPTYNTHKQIKETKKAGKVIEHTESISQKRKPVTINDGTSPVIISDEPVSLYLECSSPSITIDAPAVELLVAKKETTKVCRKDTRWIGLWDNGKSEKSHDIVYDPSYDGTLNTTAEVIHIQETKNNIPTAINTTRENAFITRSLLENVHDYQKNSIYNRPTKVAIGIVALSISIAMQVLGPVVGTGITAKFGIEAGVTSALTTQATLGAMNALCFEAANALLHCNGDFHGAAKKIASTETIKNIALTALTAAATGATAKLLDKVIPALPHATTFGERLASTAPREIANNGIRLAGDIAQGKNPKDAVKYRCKATAANIFGAACSSQIGQAYGDEKIGPGTHKLLHTGVGAVEGAIIDGKNGAIAGMIGAGVSELVADLAAPKPPTLDDIKILESELGRRLTQDEFAREWNKQTVQYLKQAHSVGDTSKIIAATVATLVNQDMDLAYNTATKAIDNNYLGLIDYGIFAIDVAYALYQVPQIYEENGIEDTLKYLGVEVCKSGANLALCRGTEKIVLAVGGRIYPSASLAINAALDKAPGLRHALGSFTETLITAGENFAKTGFGKQVARAGEYISQAETKICTAEDKLLGKAVKQAENLAEKFVKQLNPSLAEDLVEQVVPTNVLNKVEKQLTSNAAKESSKQLALPTPEKILSLPAPVASEVVKGVPSVLNQDVVLSMQEMSKQEIAKARNQLSVLEKQVEGFRNSVRHERVGEILNMDIDYTKFEKIQAETKIFYDIMRSTNEDINAIAKNTGINIEMLNQIKNHVFIEEHILKDNIIAQFHPHEDIAAAWKRLMDGNFVYSDLVLLEHEYAESFAVQGNKIPYDIAHEIVNKVYNWEKSYK